MSKEKIKVWQDILEIKNGRDYKKVQDENGIYPIYGSGGIMGYANDFICPEDTVIIGRKGNINNPIYVDRKFWNVDTAFGLVANTEYLFPKHLYYFCVNYNFQRLNTTVTIPSLTKSNLLKISMKLPSLDVQKYIADTLDKTQEIIDGHKKQLDELDNLIKATFYDMFRDPNDNRFDKNTLPQIAKGNKNSIKRGPFGGSLKKDDFVENGYLVYEQRHAIHNDFEYEKYYVTKEKYEQMIDFKVEPKDLIISCSGVTLGRIAEVPLDAKKGIINQALLKLSLDSNKINNTFFIYLFRSKVIQDILFGVSRGSGIPNFPSMSVIKNIGFIVPPLDLQTKFAEVVTNIEQQKTIVKQSIKESQNLFNSLMSKYFD